MHTLYLSHLIFSVWKMPSLVAMDAWDCLYSQPISTTGLNEPRYM